MVTTLSFEQQIDINDLTSVLESIGGQWQTCQSSPHLGMGVIEQGDAWVEVEYYSDESPPQLELILHGELSVPIAERFIRLALNKWGGTLSGFKLSETAPTAA